MRLKRKTKLSEAMLEQAGISIPRLALMALFFSGGLCPSSDILARVDAQFMAHASRHIVNTEVDFLHCG